MAAAAATRTPQHIARAAAGHRVLGLAALALAAAHLPLLAWFPHSAGWTLALLVMTAWCLKCSWCALRGGPATTLLLMCALMGAAHVAMAIGIPWFAGHHAPSRAHPGGHGALMLLVAAGEFALMFGSALVIRGQARCRMRQDAALAI